MHHLDATLTVDERVGALLGVMTLPEKAHQLTGIMAFDLIRPDGSDLNTADDVLSRPPGHVAQLIRDDPRLLADDVAALQRRFLERTRLGIPALFHAEALNGLLAGGHMTFPTAIGLAAAWKPELVEQMARLMRHQLRRVGMRHVLSPVMDVALDPRWGRVHETYGEDPYLVTANSVAYVRGMQGDDLRDGVIATGKHFLGYAAPEAGLNAATIPVGPRRLRDLFAVPFEAAIQLAGLGSIMNSYSDIDGAPVAASREILTGLLRDELGFDGFVSADYASVEQLMTVKGVARDLSEAGRLAIEAGLDVEFPRPAAYGDRLVEEVESGRLAVDVVDTAVARVLAAKFRVGLFEQPYPQEVIDLPAIAAEGDELSLELARRSVVLLENDGLVPLEPSGRRIAIVGPHADAPELQFAAYSYPSWRQAVDAIHLGGEITMVGVDERADAWHQALLPAGEAQHLARERLGTLSLADALSAADAEVVHAAGSGITERLGDAVIAEAVDASRSADLTILALGGASLWFSGERTEGEASDTADIALPSAQAELVDRIAETGRPFAIVLVQGRPYTLPAAASRARALLVSSFGGPHGARAVVDVLTGVVPPIGRLPYSIPRHGGQIPIYHHRATGSGGRPASAEHQPAYLDMPATPAHPFGSGLSTTTFELGQPQVPARIGTSDELSVAVDIRNTGPRDGATIVQLYLRVRGSGLTRPFQQLAGFQEVTLATGAAARVRFMVDSSQLAHTRPDLRLVIDPVDIDVVVGLHAEDDSRRGRVVMAGPSRDLDRSQRVHFSRSSVETA
ncbi:glycoside hydrolase family 3 C-terminal domain-containing protein [Rathayibacter festucae]|uniref:glycoside hydrolase family 3 N-terminal domain-containing protein n=1 Tax=Rathayibacter festucae TaxID=110937 RepID=UPI001FB23A41|nr:glycoside hydrolase family 3 N-terminal domain-containing protein [Rathayibacter festucae]MCJ1701807.1 glycoside hydrolase family 3 C-terminal domain-containing protein [Rathayibacter festucae]